VASTAGGTGGAGAALGEAGGAEAGAALDEAGGAEAAPGKTAFASTGEAGFASAGATPGHVGLVDTGTTLGNAALAVTGSPGFVLPVRGVTLGNAGAGDALDDADLAVTPRGGEPLLDSRGNRGAVVGVAAPSGGTRTTASGAASRGMAGTAGGVVRGGSSGGSGGGVAGRRMVPGGCEPAASWGCGVGPGAASAVPGVRDAALSRS
jgi:hypothetical protein